MPAGRLGSCATSLSCPITSARSTPLTPKSGTPDEEVQRLADAIDWATGQPDAVKGPIGLVGYSLGSALSLRYAEINPKKITAIVDNYGPTDQMLAWESAFAILRKEGSPNDWPPGFSTIIEVRTGPTGRGSGARYTDIVRDSARAGESVPIELDGGVKGQVAVMDLVAR